MKQHLQIAGIDFQFLIEARADQLAVADVVRPGFVLYHVFKGGKRLFARVGQTFPLVIESIGDVRFVVAARVALSLDDGEFPVAERRQAIALGFNPREVALFKHRPLQMQLLHD